MVYCFLFVDLTFPVFIVAIHLELPYIFIHVEDVLGFDVQSHSSCFSIIVVGGELYSQFTSG